jgi:hypothetical protein
MQWLVFATVVRLRLERKLLPLAPQRAAHSRARQLPFGRFGVAGFQSQARFQVARFVFVERDDDTWRMPPLHRLAPARLSLAAKTWMGVLRLYLVVAGGLVLFRIVMLASGQG